MTGRPTEVTFKAVRKRQCSKAVTVCSKNWGITKGMQTPKWHSVETKEVATQWEDLHEEPRVRYDPPSPDVIDSSSSTDFCKKLNSKIIVDPEYTPDSDSLPLKDPHLQYLESNVESIDEPTPPDIEAKYMVFESCLLDLFRVCPVCHGKSPQISHIKGTMVVIKQLYQEPAPCGLVRKWFSQPFIGNLPAGNILLSSAILFNGASPKKVLKVLSAMNMESIAYSSFMEHQRLYFQPTVVNIWSKMQQSLIDQLKDTNQQLVIGGDARNDSPGHTAKYGSYSFLEQNINKVIHVELVQVRDSK
ncbi:uncharacterized protein [Apostichopus japonicus]|uniref:uncharacterized protein isoform X1 n=1 Tax=Stichopus japonicus TaxID=307972 RepID=UPI003AB5B5A6